MERGDLPFSPIPRATEPPSSPLGPDPDSVLEPEWGTESETTLSVIDLTDESTSSNLSVIDTSAELQEIIKMEKMEDHVLVVLDPMTSPGLVPLLTDIVRVQSAYGVTVSEMFSNFLLVGVFPYNPAASIRQNSSTLVRLIRSRLYANLLSPEYVLVPPDVPTLFKTYFDVYPGTNTTTGKRTNMVNILRDANVYITNPKDETPIRFERGTKGIAMSSVLSRPSTTFMNAVKKTAHPTDRMLIDSVSVTGVLRIQISENYFPNFYWFRMTPPFLTQNRHLWPQDRMIAPSPKAIWLPYNEDVDSALATAGKKIQWFTYGHIAAHRPDRDVPLGVWIRPPPFSIVATMISPGGYFPSMFTLIYSPYLITALLSDAERIPQPWGRRQLDFYDSQLRVALEEQFAETITLSESMSSAYTIDRQVDGIILIDELTPRPERTVSRPFFQGGRGPIGYELEESDEEDEPFVEGEVEDYDDEEEEEEGEEDRREFVFDGEEAGTSKKERTYNLAQARRSMTNQPEIDTPKTKPQSVANSVKSKPFPMPVLASPRVAGRVASSAPRVKKSVPETSQYEEAAIEGMHSLRRQTIHRKKEEETTHAPPPSQSDFLFG